MAIRQHGMRESLDTPRPGTLAQVFFGVAAGMAPGLYLFAIEGWLR